MWLEGSHSWGMLCGREGGLAARVDGPVIIIIIIKRQQEQAQLADAVGSNSSSSRLKREIAERARSFHF